MPAQRPRASFEPIAPDFDLDRLVENTPNFSYVDRINCDMIAEQGLAQFEKLVLLHVIQGGKPLIIDGFEQYLDPWTFTQKWLRDNCGDKVENAQNLMDKTSLPLTLQHYLKNMSILANQFFDKPLAYKEKKRQRMYLKDIDCPPVWWDKVREHIPPVLAYLNESTGELGGPGAVPDVQSSALGNRLGRGVARAGDLMSSLPPDMRAENLMCYIGHEGTFTPAHREMCASLGHNIMVEASSTIGEDGQVEKPGSSIWFMTESKDRHLVSEYWLSVLGHDIEVENHFAQVVAWKKAPFSVYVVDQKPGDLILIPPLAPHQVWNRGTRTMKVAWNRTTVETLEMALEEALPRSRVVCRDEQYKNKAIIYYTLQKYFSLLTHAHMQATRMPPEAGHAFLYTGKLKQLIRDFKKLFVLYKQILLSESFNPSDRDSNAAEYIPFDSNVTCAYCRCNIFNRFLTCPACKDVLGHHADEGGEGDPYDICMECYAMGRSCACLSNLKWVEQFKWKELNARYETWRQLIIALDGGQIKSNTPGTFQVERSRLSKKTLAEICKEQLKRRPFKDFNKAPGPKDDDDDDEEIVVGDDGLVKRIKKKRSKAWEKQNQPCHVCCYRHPIWKMANCTTCDRWWCYGTLFRGWDKMPQDIMADTDWSCPHCLKICFAGNCRKDPEMTPYEPKGTLLGHDTKKVADVRSVEALVDFSVSNLNWIKGDDPEVRTESTRFKKAEAEARRSKEVDHTLLDDDDDGLEVTQLRMEGDSPQDDFVDPALGGNVNGYADNDDGDDALARRLQVATSNYPQMPSTGPYATSHQAPNGYVPLGGAELGAPHAPMYPAPEQNSYNYLSQSMDAEQPTVRPSKRRAAEDADADGDEEDIAMQKAPKAKKPRLAAAGFRSSDLAEAATGPSASKAKNEAQRQFEREKERKALDKAKAEGRFIQFSAALRGKKRIVKLRVPGHQLAQVLAQQTARAALNIGANVPDPEPEKPPADLGDNADDNDVLLKSDIPVKKPKPSGQSLYEKAVQSGAIITSVTKKARVPVEKDDSYSYRERVRLPSGKRVTAMSTTTVQKSKRRGPAKIYEEVDVGSSDDEQSRDDPDDADFGSLTFSAINQVSAEDSARKARHSLPGNLHAAGQREEDDNSELPDELPGDNLASSHRPKPPLHTATSSKTAGKRPSMRPAHVPIATSTADIDSDDDDENLDGDTDIDSFVARAASGQFGDETMPTSFNGASSASKPRGRPRNKPSKTLGPKSSASFKAKAPPATFQHETQVISDGGESSDGLENMFEDNNLSIEEQNRLAKLQVLQEMS
ncbi:uncharacterized protein K489DRAFT_324364 [Dissoconium aciculare CBS 342.82]|uniref:JmjC domain-containing protein n=1 Tax=Dissoconium aciculare CBS 342.82 TaxID=1314786 RepID=A0A6J3LY82_9PEZI|nr:uncharacterized protein K489DRAFT_324364 [Dissoconium aciculare CBS 342.82]KAF1820259.1 hypothetical protein K489DRAFT_324364 [Dissoconium aciculare CBS 342.82]